MKKFYSFTNDTNNEILIANGLRLLKYFIFFAKDFQTVSPVLSTLIKGLKHSEETVIVQTCHTLLIFSQSFRESRQSIIDSNVCKRLTDLWLESLEKEEIFRSIFSIIKSILPRFNDYKNHFLSKELNILEMIPKLVKSNEENRIYATDIIKMISMKPLNAQKYSSTEQINTIIKYKVIEDINNLLENDESNEVKSSALNAIFILAKNCELDQLNKLAEQGI